MSPSLVVNGDLAPVKSGAVTGRVASVYSEVQSSRIDHALPLPSVLNKPFKIVDGPASSAAGNPGLIVVDSVDVVLFVCCLCSYCGFSEIELVKGDEFEFEFDVFQMRLRSCFLTCLVSRRQCWCLVVVKR